MQTSSPSTPRPSQPKQILLIGLPGSGKTKFLLSFPGLYILDADLNLDGAELLVRKENPGLSFKYDTLPIDDLKQEVPEHMRFDRMMKLTLEAKKDPDTQLIAYDSLTNIIQYLVWQIQASQKRDTMEIRDWGLHKGSMLSLLIKQRLTGKHVIFTAHREDKTKKVKTPTGKDTLEEEITGYLPSANPALQKDLAGMFTDVWHMYLKPRPGGVYENWIETMPTPMMSYLKNSMGLPPTLDVTKDAWKTLSKWWPK